MQNNYEGLTTEQLVRLRSKALADYKFQADMMAEEPDDRSRRYDYSDAQANYLRLDSLVKARQRAQP